MTRLAALLLLAAVPASASPDFIPSPKQSFEGFTALSAPRPEVPIGALWVENYGPTGEAAGPDNVETVRSLSSLAIDRSLQLSLTAGLFDLIGIEPRYRDRFTARFTDLSIVRVRDIARLAGPKGEPRILEALKAGTVTVTSDGEAGLNARTGWQLSNDGSTASGRTRAYSIEARDMFIAVRVGTQELTLSQRRELRLATAETRQLARIDDFEIALSFAECGLAAAADCTQAPRFTIRRISTHPDEGQPAAVEADAGGAASLSLPVPVADEKGGLYSRINLRLIEPCPVRKVEDCGRRRRLFAHYSGERIAAVRLKTPARW